MDIYQMHKHKCEEVTELQRRINHLEYENKALKQQLLRAEIKLGERDANGKLLPVQNLEIKDRSNADNDSSLSRDIKYLARKKREDEFDWDVGY